MYCSQDRSVEIEMKKMKTLMNMLMAKLFLSLKKAPKSGPVVGELDPYTCSIEYHLLRMVTAL